MLIAALMGAGTMGALALPHTLLDWQPAHAASHPWRAWTAVFVHYSALHVAANLAGLALIAALGWAAQLPRRSVVAWAAAWPLTQIGLLMQPQLLHYGGLSGVLHAGLAVVAVHLVATGGAARRGIGLAIVAALGLKLLLEAPWAGPLRHVRGWDIAIAPLAHASGVAAGLVCSALTEFVAHQRKPGTGIHDHD